MRAPDDVARQSRSSLRHQNDAALFLLAWPLLLVACAIVYSGSPPSARASNFASMTSARNAGFTPVPYSGPPYVDRRDYTVVIQRNGDVSIVEHWMIRINTMPNEIWLIMSSAQTTGIEFENVVGGGVHFERSYVAHDLGASAPTSDIQWYFVASQTQGSQAQDSGIQELRTYSFDVSYILHGALGLSATRAWLDWQFLDTGSGINRLSSCTVSISLPALASPHNIQVAATDPDSALATEIVDGAAIVSSAASLDENNPLEVEVSFPRSLLSPSVKRPPWQHSDTPPVPPTSLGAPRALLIFNVGYPFNPSDPPSPPPFHLLTPASCTCCLILIILLAVAPLARWRLQERAERRTAPRWPRSPSPDTG